MQHIYIYIYGVYIPLVWTTYQDLPNSRARETVFSTLRERRPWSMVYSVLWYTTQWSVAVGIVIAVGVARVGGVVLLCLSFPVSLSLSLSIYIYLVFLPFKAQHVKNKRQPLWISGNHCLYPYCTVFIQHSTTTPLIPYHTIPWPATIYPGTTGSTSLPPYPISINTYSFDPLYPL